MATLVQVGRVALSVLAATPPSVGSPQASPTTSRFFFHNWVESATLECAYETDVVSSRDSVTEERRGLLGKPEKVQTCRFSGLTKDKATYLLAMLARASVGRTLIPIYSSQAYLTAAVSGATVPCDTTFKRFHVGGKVLLVNPATDTFEVAEISGVQQSSLVLTGSPTGTFDTTECLVFPLFDAEMIVTSDFQLVTDHVGEVTVAFKEVQGDGALPPLAQWSPPLQLVDGYPVLRSQPNWADGVRVGLRQQGEVVSLGRGTHPATRGARPLFEFSLAFQTTTRRAAFELIAFFDSCQGRLRPFWLINPHTLFTAATITTTYVDVERFSSDAGHTDLEEFLSYVVIELTDGTVYIRGIDSVADTGTYHRITFDSVIPSTLIADVDRVTSAHFVRFGSDALAEGWVTDRVCTFAFELIEILNETTAAITNLIDTPTVSSYNSIGNGPWSHFSPSKHVYETSTPNEIASAGVPNGDGDEAAYVYDVRELLPLTGLPSSISNYYHLVNAGLSGTILLHEVANFLVGRGRSCLHFNGSNSDVLNFVAGPLSPNEEWFSNVDGFTMFVVVTDLQNTLTFFEQTGVLEWTETDIRFYDDLSVYVVNHNLIYTDSSPQVIADNVMAIYALRWDPGVSAEVWKNGDSLGTPTTVVVDLPSGGGTPFIGGNDAKMYEHLIYKEALSNDDLNAVAGLLAALYNVQWVDVT